MAGITHLTQFQEPALRRLVDLTEESAPETFADRFLPTVPTDKREFAYDIVKTSDYIAAYIGLGSEPPYIDRDALSSRMGTIAQFGLADQVDYEEQLAIHESRNNDEKRRAIDAITNKNVKILEGMRRLIYLAKMEVLFKGTHVFNETDDEKNQITFDFGIPAENKVALLPGADFDTPTFDVIGFLQTQVEAYEDANDGKSPEVLIGSKEIRGKLLRNTNLITEAGRPEGSTRISVDELNTVFDNFDLPRLEIAKERTVRYKQNGTNVIITKEVVPSNRLTFLSAGIGEYLLGPTLENNFRPGLFLEAEDLKRPIRSVLTGVGAGFPAPSTPSLIFHMDVFTP